MCMDPLSATMLVTAAAGTFQAASQYQQGYAMSKYYSALQTSKQQEASYDLAIGQRQGELIEDTASIESKQLAVKQAEANASSQASAAARGVQGGATAEDIVKSNLTKEQLDQDLLKYNASVKEWGVNEQAKGAAWAANTEAAEYGASSKNAKVSGRNQAIGTILGTAASIGTAGWLAGVGTKAASTGMNAAKFSKGLFAGLGG